MRKREKGLSYKYEVLSEAVQTDEGCFEVYGIKAEMYEDGRLECESRVSDIFCSREEAEEFAALLRECGLDPCNLQEVAEDWLQRQ